MQLSQNNFFLALGLVLVVVGLAGCALQKGATLDNVATTSTTIVTEDAFEMNTEARDQNNSSDQVVDTDGDVNLTAQATVTTDVKEFDITAKNWEFTPGVVTVNKGDRVRFKITSVDVDHGFAIAAFNVNQKLTPGKTEIVEFTADKSGTYTFFCSVMCGGGHRDMKGTLIVK